VHVVALAAALCIELALHLHLVESLKTATTLSPCKVDEMRQIVQERVRLASKSKQNERVRFMLLLGALELNSARLECMNHTVHRPQLRWSDEVVPSSEEWAAPSSIELCDAKYELAKSILDFVVEVKDDCSVLEHLFFQAAQLLESVIVTSSAYKFEDSNAVYSLTRCVLY
jgi:hypothetical protein